MDIPKGTTIFILRDGAKIYGEPVISDDWLVRRATTGSKKTYNPEWKYGWLVGEATGEKKTQNGVTFYEIDVRQAFWSQKSIFARWDMVNQMGYIPLSTFGSDFYLFSKDGKPVNFPETVTDPKTGLESTTEDSNSTTSVLWVLVVILAMVAGYKALNRKRK